MMSKLILQKKIKYPCVKFNIFPNKSVYTVSRTSMVTANLEKNLGKTPGRIPEEIASGLFEQTPGGFHNDAAFT